MVCMGEMARVNRSRAAWFGAMSVVAAAAFVALRSCGTEPDAGPVARPPHADVSAVDGPAREQQRRHAAGDASDPAPQNAPAPAAPAGPEEETVTLNVTVKRADGSPAAGATVLLFERWNRDWNDPMKSATAGDAGVASFRVPNWMYRVVAYQGSAVAISDGGTMPPGTTVTLAPGIVVRGRVVDANRSPVAGASVRYAADNWRTTGVGFWLPVRAKDDGTFELLPLPPAAFDADTPATVEARATGFPERGVPLDAAAAAKEVVVELVRGLRVRGRIVDEDGAAIPDIAIECEEGGRDARARTDSSGAFDLTIPAEGGRVVARREWKEKDPVYPENEIEHGAALLLGAFAAGAADVDLGLVRFPRGTPVRGVVVDAAGAAVAGASVLIELGETWVESANTGEDGRFVFPQVGRDPHTIRVSRGAPWAAVSTVRDDVRGGGEELRIALTGAGTILVRFVDDTGALILLFDPVVRWTGEGASDSVAPGSATDAVRIAPAKDGTYTLTVEGRALETRTVDGVVAHADRETVVSVVLHRRPNAKPNARTVLLAFVDPETRAPLPLQHAELFTRPSGATDFGRPQTWTGGPFQEIRFEPAKAGRYDLLVKVPGCEPFTATVDVTEDDEARVEVPLRKKAD
jgi:carboxypeptidase family protein